jgi:glyoxylase-like metal-dependent hydrolase (beta-lactamase superfamily II)
VPAADIKALKAGQLKEHSLRAVAKAMKLGGEALVAIARKQWYPAQPLFPRGFAMFNTPFGDMTVNSYLVWDVKTRLAAAFDTGATAESMLDIVKTEKLNLRYLFVTHTHDDHIADLAKVAATGAEVWSSDLEPVNHPGAKTFKENAHFHLGELAIKTLFTFGHSPGQTTYYVTGLAWPLAIVGDSLFAGSMGGSATHYEDQFKNNRRKILNLPGDTVIAAGHGPLSTLKQEKQYNPFFTR